MYVFCFICFLFKVNNNNKKCVLNKQTLPFESLGSVTFLRCLFRVHRGCIYLKLKYCKQKTEDLIVVVFLKASEMVCPTGASKNLIKTSVFP